MGDTVQAGRRRAVVRVHGTDKALAITSDCTPRYCFADPSRGRQAGGGRGLAQPDRRRRDAAGDHQQPELRQSRAPRDHGAVRRLSRRHGEACAALDFPVVSGNVSLYNESKATGGSAILPTPAIGGVGLLEDCDEDTRRSPSRARGDVILDRRTRGGMARPVDLSCANAMAARKVAPPPSISTPSAKARRPDPRAIGNCSAVHDVSDGGLAVDGRRDGAGRRDSAR